MRISDWSSDVCSSDLLQSAAIVASEEKNEIAAARAALEELASQSAVVAFTPGGCGQALLRLRARSENRYSNLMALRLDGAVACATGLEQPSTFEIGRANV